MNYYKKGSQFRMQGNARSKVRIKINQKEITKK